MEFNISDLLDDYQDASIPLEPCMGASTDRIKEITMKKIHNEKQEKSAAARFRPVGRVALIAAIILALATTVMAASGLHFIDWVTRNPEKSYDEDVTNGAGWKCWDIGDHTISLGAEYASTTNLVIMCEDLGPEGLNELTVSPDYWLEQWDGEAYVPMGITLQDEQRTIVENETTYWELNWDQELTDGFYRVGMTLSGTKKNGEADEAVCYVKFRVYQAEMSSAIEKCITAMEKLETQDSYHLTLTCHNVYNSGPEWYTYYTNQVWKSGENFLREMQYIDDRVDPAVVVSGSGSMVLDGTCYGLDWEEYDAESAITHQEILLYRSAADYSMWTWFFDPDSALTGEVYVDGNITRIIKNTGCAGVAYTELTYTFDDAGNLKRIVNAYLPTRDCAEEEREVHYVLDVHDTSPEDCEKMIRSQDISVLNTFSWAEDQAANPDARREGFANTTPSAIESTDEAIEAAKNDTTMTTDERYIDGYFYHTIIVSYDESADMWRVEFTFPQNERNYQAVYLTSDGITKMVVDRTKTE